MNSITVDTANQTATIGAGCRLGDVTERLFTDGLAVPAGTCAPVGIAGIAIGGGHGVSSRKFGLTTDNLLSDDGQKVEKTHQSTTLKGLADGQWWWD